MSARLSVARLRAAFRDRYILYPDSSKGQDYINHGILSGLRIVAELAGDLDFTTRCESEGDYRQIGSRNWCKAHFAPMGSQWSCDLAETPWLWRDVAARAALPAEGTE